MLPNPIAVTPLSSTNKKFYIPKKSVWPLMEQAVARFHVLNNIEIPFVHNDAFIFDNDILILEHFFLSEDCRKILNNHRISLALETDLEFYTDGSHLFIPSPLQSFLSSAFTLVHDSLDVSYAAALPPFWANSTNAEIFALLMTLFICPFNSNIKINTDSLALIISFNRLKIQNAVLYPSILFSTPFYIYWCFIFKLIEQKQLSISLIKVKAHSDNHFNDLVDRLAKASLTNPPIEFSFSHVPYLSFIPTFKANPINKEIRPFFKDYTNTKLFNDFYSLKRNELYHNKSINWLCTFNLINSGSPTHTSFEESSRHKRKYQFLLEQLPTLEFLKESRPDLYDNNWQCCRCLTHLETFNHLWTCPQGRRTINTIINHALTILKDQLFIHTSSREWSDDLSQIFDPLFTFWTFSTPSSSSFNFIDIIKGIVPAYLYNCINSFTKNKRKTNIVLSTLYDCIFDQIFNLIWKPRCALTIARELSIGITKKKKRSKCSSPHTNYHTNASIQANISDHSDLFSNSYTHGRSWPLFNAVKTSCFFSFFVCHVLTFLLIVVD
jgi:hypothetical protein